MSQSHFSLVCSSGATGGHMPFQFFAGVTWTHFSFGIVLHVVACSLDM